MLIHWNQRELQRYIDEGIEESLTLDYKAADALGPIEGKKAEVTKDVSAMANSAGGIIIYGIKEFSDPAKKHLPEMLDGIDRTRFTKERLEHIINNIQPRINGLVIHPVDIDTAPNHVAYVVEIPQSATAHQAKDFRYYKRFNFESVPMYDHEVRDVMHRQTLPDLDVEFGYRKTFSGSNPAHPMYVLEIKAKNIGVKAIEHYKLQFTFPIYDREKAHAAGPTSFTRGPGKFGFVINDDNYEVTTALNEHLFPKEEIDIGKLNQVVYYMSTNARHQLQADVANGRERKLTWILYADDMPPKTGDVSLTTLFDY